MKIFLSLLIVTVSITQIFSQPVIKIIQVHELAAILDESLLIIDVRTGPEFSQGHIPGAINIDIQANNFVQQIENFDHNRPVYLYCRSGNRSYAAAEMLISKGFTNVYSLDGGMLQWQRAKKPINY